VLNGISIPCLVTQNSSNGYRRTMTNLFGGGAGNEGMGLFELSFDWQYISSVILSYPILQQANSWIGYAICYGAVFGIYYSNVWDSKNLPLLSTSIFSNTSTPGNPLFTGSYTWSLMAQNWSVCTVFYSGVPTSSIPSDFTRSIEFAPNSSRMMV